MFLFFVSRNVSKQQIPDAWIPVFSGMPTLCLGYTFLYLFSFRVYSVNDKCIRLYRPSETKHNVRCPRRVLPEVSLSTYKPLITWDRQTDRRTDGQMLRPTLWMRSTQRYTVVPADVGRWIYRTRKMEGPNRSNARKRMTWKCRTKSQSWKMQNWKMTERGTCDFWNNNTVWTKVLSGSVMDISAVMLGTNSIGSICICCITCCRPTAKCTRCLWSWIGSALAA